MEIITLRTFRRTLPTLTDEVEVVYRGTEGLRILGRWTPALTDEAEKPFAHLPAIDRAYLERKAR